MIKIIDFYVKGLIILLLFVFESTSTKSSPFMSASELIELEGYSWEKHVVTTTDGYVLKNYRIPGTDPKLYPVVLVHGLWSSGNDFLMKGKRSLPFMLANEGYDVWLLNLRWAQETGHVNISRTDKAFWDFGIEESGKFDVPESIDKILDVTKSKKIIYIGLSMGGLLYVVACNYRPDLVDKFAYEISFSFNWYSYELKDNIPSPDKPDFWTFISDAGLNHIEMSDIMRLLALLFCNNKSQDNFCYRSQLESSGANWNNADLENAHLLIGRYIAATIKQRQHMIDMLKKGCGFPMFNYGPVENLRKYGVQIPPMFNLTACRAPMIIYHGTSDSVNKLNDTVMAADELRASGVKVEIRTPKSKTFGHMDYFIGAKKTNRLYRDVISVMKNMKNV